MELRERTTNICWMCACSTYELTTSHHFGQHTISHRSRMCLCVYFFFIGFNFPFLSCFCSFSHFESREEKKNKLNTTYNIDQRRREQNTTFIFNFHIFLSLVSFRFAWSPWAPLLFSSILHWIFVLRIFFLLPLISHCSSRLSLSLSNSEHFLISVSFVWWNWVIRAFGIRHP